MALTRYEIGQRTGAFLNPPSTGPTTTQFQLLLSDINGALTEIVHHASGALFSARRSSGRLGGSTAMAVTATQDSEVLTLTTPGDWQDRMLGCAVLITGDARINRIEQRLLVKATGTVTFNSVPIENSVLVIGAITYRFKATRAQAYDVTIGATAAETTTNMLAALLLGSVLAATYSGIPGYYPEPHPTVTGIASGTTGIALSALVGGDAGNSLVLTTTSGAITVSGAGTLLGGTQNTVRMEFPFAGTTGSVTATVYYESWPLRSDEASVTGPVLAEMIDDGARSRMTAFAGGWEEWQDQQDKSLNFLVTSGPPDSYRIENNQSFVGTGDSRQFVTPTSWLRLNRWPSEACAVSYRASLRAPQFVLADITTNAGNGRLPSGLPEGWDDIALIPIIMWRIMAWLNFPEDVQYAQESIRTAVFEKYKRAIEWIKAQAPQSETTHSMSAG